MMTICDPTRLRVRADVDETDVPLVRPGQPVRVFLQADPINAIAGRVDLVSPKGVKAEEVVSFETLIRVDRVEETSLRPGMTATVEIEVKRAADALGVPLRLIHSPYGHDGFLVEVDEVGALVRELLAG